MRGFLCDADQQGEGVRTVWDVLDGCSRLTAQQPAAGTTTDRDDLLHEEFCGSVDGRLRLAGVRGGGSPRAAAFVKADATCRVCALPRRSIFASSIEPGISSNAPSKMARRFPKKSCENDFVRRVVPGHVAWLAFSGETEGGRDACRARRNRRRIPSTRTGCVSARASPSVRTGTTPRRSRPRASLRRPVLK